MMNGVMAENSGEGNIVQSQKISFKDSLLNSEGGGKAATDDMAIEIEDGDLIIDMNGNFSQVLFSNQVHRKITENMKNIIFVRVLGRSLGYYTHYMQLMRLWKPKWVFTMANVGFRG